MDETGEHYAKWNKPGGEGQIPYDLNLFFKNTVLLYFYRSEDLKYLKYLPILIVLYTILSMNPF